MLFFVLSGFLITYLLLAEQEKFGEIAISKFYWRRVLRIWPLYFVVVGLGFGVLAHLDFFFLPGLSERALTFLPQKLGLFALILPNVALALYPAVPYVSQAWSIGTEEQFYLFWPWVIRLAKSHVLPVLVGIAVSYIIVKRIITGWYEAEGPEPRLIVSVCYQFMSLFRIDCMAIGGLMSTILFTQRDALLRIIMSKAVQWVVIVISLVLLVTAYNFPFHDEIFALLFGIIILNLAAAERPVISLENKWFNFLGKISYGLYMLHVIAVVTVLRLLTPWFDLQGPIVGWILTLLAVMGLTVSLAAASYYWLEKPFLRFKEAFTRVRSQPDAVLPTPVPEPIITAQ